MRRVLGHQVSRRVIALAAGLLAALVVLVAALTWPDQVRPQMSAQPDPAGGRVAAAEACRQLVAFEALVDANAPVDQVRKALRSLTSSAGLAARLDAVSWVALAGGGQALSVAIEHDDPEAARVGIDTVRAACTRVRPQAPAPTAG